MLSGATQGQLTVVLCARTSESVSLLPLDTTPSHSDQLAQNLQLQPQHVYVRR